MVAVKLEEFVKPQENYNENSAQSKFSGHNPHLQSCMAQRWLQAPEGTWLSSCQGHRVPGGGAQGYLCSAEKSMGCTSTETDVSPSRGIKKLILVSGELQLEHLAA